MDALGSAFVADKEVAKEHTQRRNPELMPRQGATRPSVVEGAGNAISARVAEGRGRALGQELTDEWGEIAR